MDFIKANSTEPLEDFLVKSLTDSLVAYKKVLWLVPGGSNIAVVVRVMDRLGKMVNLNGLTLMLSDERYGKLNHKDSNYFQLKKAGLNLLGATFEPTLNGGNLEEDLAYSNNLTNRLFKNSDKVIAFLGMGSDGHIAGILPNSPAVKSKDLIAAYKADDFTRITLTPKAFLAYIDTVIVGAFGEAKKSQLEILKNQEVSIDEQPAQLLKQIKNVAIFNDQI